MGLKVVGCFVFLISDDPYSVFAKQLISSKQGSGLTSSLLDYNLPGLVTKLYPILLTPWTVAHQVLCPWDFPGKNTGVGCHSLLQGIFLNQGSNATAGRRFTAEL